MENLTNKTTRELYEEQSKMQDFIEKEADKWFANTVCDIVFEDAVRKIVQRELPAVDFDKVYWSTEALPNGKIELGILYNENKSREEIYKCFHSPKVYGTLYYFKEEYPNDIYLPAITEEEDCLLQFAETKRLLQRTLDGTCLDLMLNSITEHKLDIEQVDFFAMTPPQRAFEYALQIAKDLIDCFTEADYKTFADKVKKNCKRGKVLIGKQELSFSKDTAKLITKVYCTPSNFLYTLQETFKEAGLVSTLQKYGINTYSLADFYEDNKNAINILHEVAKAKENELIEALNITLEQEQITSAIHSHSNINSRFVGISRIDYNFSTLEYNKPHKYSSKIHKGKKNTKVNGSIMISTSNSSHILEGMTEAELLVISVLDAYIYTGNLDFTLRDLFASIYGENTEPSPQALHNLENTLLKLQTTVLEVDFTEEAQFFGLERLKIKSTLLHCKEIEGKAKNGKPLIVYRIIQDQRTNTSGSAIYDYLTTTGQYRIVDKNLSRPNNINLTPTNLSIIHYLQRRVETIRSMIEKKQKQKQGITDFNNKLVITFTALYTALKKEKPIMMDFDTKEEYKKAYQIYRTETSRIRKSVIKILDYWKGEQYIIDYDTSRTDAIEITVNRIYGQKQLS